MNTTTLPTGTWELDASATTVTVSVKKLGFLTVPATLTVTSGSIQIDEQNQVAGVQVEVDAASYKSKNAKRNEHVVSADGLDAGVHPTIAFSATSVTANGAGYTAAGTITVKGKSSPMQVDIADVQVGEGTASFTATGTADRFQLGVDGFPKLVVGSALTLTVAAKANRK